MDTHNNEFTRAITAESESELWSVIVAGRGTPKGAKPIHDWARNQIVLRYVPVVRKMVAYMVRRYQVPLTAADDLFDEGMIGLMQAVERFDPANGTSFGEYCKPRVRGQMKDSLRKMLPCGESIDAPSSDDEQLSIKTSLEDNGEWFEHVDDREAASRMLRSLPDRQRRIVELYVMGGMTMREIGETMGLSESWVSVEYRRAFDVLRARFILPTR